MRSGGVGLILVLFLTVVAAAPAGAHHVIAAKFDPANAVTLNGTVVGIDWGNPHAHMFIDVKTGNTTTNWAIELESPSDLRKSGWTRETVKIGEAVTVQGITARDGSKQAWANSVTLTAAKKRVFAVATAQPKPGDVQSTPTPRWPDGQPRLGPVPGERGYWGKPSSTAMVQSGVTVAMEAGGILRNVGDIDKVAPFQRWARDLYELRQRSFLKSDPMYLFCIPPGGPRQFQLPYGVQFVEDREKKRIMWDPLESTCRHASLSIL